MHSNPHEVTQERVQHWTRSWELVIGKLTAISTGPRGGGILASYLYEPEVDLREVELQLGRKLPSAFSALLHFAGVHYSACASLPSGILAPLGIFEFDFGWSLSSLRFEPMFDEDGEEQEQQRYLTFHTAGNGDALVFDLQHPSGSAVLSWSHEENEFRLLAPSLPEFLDRVTELCLIGACADAYLPFLGPDGLEPEGDNGQVAKKWLHDYMDLDWNTAKQELSTAILFCEMHASDQESRPEAGTLLVELYDPTEILAAWIARNEPEQAAYERRDRLIFIGDTLRNHAADWVRSLWTTRTATGIEATSETITANSSALLLLPPGLQDDVLHNLTALCLPEDEGLPLVLREIERKAKEAGRPITAPTHSLTAFHSRHIIRWMEPHVAFPFDGWNTLLAASQPEAQDLIRWLQGTDAQRMTAVSAIGMLSEKSTASLFNGPNSHAEHTELLRLLHTLHTSAVLRKEKAAIAQAIAALALPLT